MGNENSTQVIGPYYTNRIVLNSATFIESHPLSTIELDTEDRAAFIDENTLAGYLRDFILDLKADYISPDGLTVNYQGIKQSPKYKKYVLASSLLQHVSLTELSEHEKKAFYVNIYNALVIHALCEGLLSDPASSFSRVVFYARVSYDIGGTVFTLNDIENGLMRRNRRSPLPMTHLPFSLKDPRQQFMLSECDPRIHFALNCGAHSCPPIREYSSEASELDAQLNLATEGFLEAEVIPLKHEGIIRLSMIFLWYQIDFGHTEDQMLEWICLHATKHLAKKIRKMLESSPKPVLKYSSYNWSLNA